MKLDRAIWIEEQTMMTGVTARLRRLDWAAVAAFVVPFWLYVLTLAPTIYNLDSAELTTAAATGGIIRATGYPLYSVLGYLWSLVPVGDVGYRLNLFAAACGAGTVLAGELILRRLRVSGAARFGALGLLATAPYFWAMSVIAEVYTLHTALMGGVIVSLLRWGDRPTPLRLGVPVLLMALSMGNHAATVLLIPGCVWYVATRAPRELLQARNWLAMLGAGALGATVFLYLPLRYGANPVFNYAGEFDSAGLFHPVNLRTWDGFTWLVTGRTFAGQMFGYRLNEIGAQVWLYVVQLWQAFFVVGVGPGLVGAWLLIKRDWRTGIMVLLMFALSAVFYINYRVVDKDTMFLPTYLAWALWLGVGYEWLLQSVRALGGARHGATARAALQLVFVGAVVLSLGWNWARVDRSQDWSARVRGETILQEVAADAVVLGWWDTVPLVQYLQLIEGARPDVLAINRFLMDGDAMTAFILEEVHNRPIYIDNPPLFLIQQLDVTRDGILYRLEPRPAAPGS